MVRSIRSASPTRFAAIGVATAAPLLIIAAYGLPGNEHRPVASSERHGSVAFGSPAKVWPEPACTARANLSAGIGVSAGVTFPSKGGGSCTDHISTTGPFFETMSKRRKGFPSEAKVKRGVRVVHGDKELAEK